MSTVVMWRNERSTTGFQKIICIPQTFEKQITQFFPERMFLYVVYYETYINYKILNIKYLRFNHTCFSQTTGNGNDCFFYFY